MNRRWNKKSPMNPTVGGLTPCSPWFLSTKKTQNPKLWSIIYYYYLCFTYTSKGSEDNIHIRSTIHGPMVVLVCNARNIFKAVTVKMNKHHAAHWNSPIKWSNRWNKCVVAEFSVSVWCLFYDFLFNRAILMHKRLAGVHIFRSGRFVLTA